MSLHLVSMLSVAGLCLFLSTVLLNPADTTQTLGLSFFSLSLSLDHPLPQEIWQRGVQNTHCCLSNSSVFRKLDRKRNVGRRKEGKRYLFSLQCCKALVRSQRNSHSCQSEDFSHVFYMFLFELTGHRCHRVKLCVLFSFHSSGIDYSCFPFVIIRNIIIPLITLSGDMEAVMAMA